MNPHTAFTARENLYSDILTTAVEGGINYWAQVSNYDHGIDFDNIPNRRVALASVTVHPNEEDMFDASDLHEKQPHGTERVEYWDGTTADAVAVPVTVATVRRGWNLVKNGGVVNERLTSKVRTADRDMENADFDAELADAVLQAGVFGKVMFG